ncbi:hypothetical protein [Absidia glauca]|uniref:Acetolactate synthase n=1 Tax=Absidia glauca TaxID=4829 RepID=A0A163JP37_ABSGL|nr:hypothetical protein [Absidia glauca]
MLNPIPKRSTNIRKHTLYSTKSGRNVHTTSAMPDSLSKTTCGKQQLRSDDNSNNDALELDHTFVGRNGGDIFHDMMVRHQVDYVFGYPGGAILPVFDGFHSSPFVKIILPRHEQGGGHMAEGYAKATGRPGVVLVTSGPGATNVITALADAYADAVPLVVFTGQVAISAIGSGAFQEVDMLSMSRSCTKWNVMVKDIADLPRLIDQAFEMAVDGRPGPVLVDLPKNVTSSILKRPVLMKKQQQQQTAHTPPSSDMDNLLKQAATMINNASRPVIYAGQGVNCHPDGPATLARLAHEGNIPVTTTLHGLGTFDEKDPKSLHMLGMHGSAYANLAMQHADVIIAIGARFDDRATMNVKGFAPGTRQDGGIIHFEILAGHINKTVKSDLAIMGDATTNVQHMLPWIRTNPDRTAWFDTIAGWKRQYPFYYEPAPENAVLKPQQLIDELEKQTAHCKHTLTITTGVGSHQMWAAQLIRWRHPRTMITSGSLGTMGFGVPSAIGAKLARPHHTVIDIDGDASFSMTAMEMATAAQYNVGIKVLLLNNSSHAMVGQFQDLHYGYRYTATEMVNPDFIDFGKAVHVKAIKVTKTSEIPSKMKEFLDYDGPVLMEAVVSSDEHLYPTVLMGNSLDQFIAHPNLGK